MTTVQVEFRHKNHDAELTHKDPGWRQLTSTISRPDAERIIAALEPTAWVARLTPIGRVPSSSLADVLVKLGADADTDFTAAYRRIQKGSETTEDVEHGLAIVRRWIYGIFECHGHAPDGVFKRWQKVKIEHTKSCKAPKIMYEVQITEAKRASTWLIRSEMERRVTYLNDHALPGLGMNARARTMPVRMHGGACPKCKKSAMGYSIAIEISFGDHIMVREYDAG